MVHCVSVSGPQSCALSLHCRGFSVVSTHNLRKFRIQGLLFFVDENVGFIPAVLETHRGSGGHC
jgi:hypothetical protein